MAMGALPSLIEKFLNVHTKLGGYHPSYGTAGFRDKAENLPGIVFRCGLLVAARAVVTGKSTGIMITASHNPAADNGVKLVEPDGSMLIIEWEEYANQLAGADDAVAVAQILCRAMGAHHTTAQGSGNCCVLIGHDTRPSCPSLVQAATDGVEIICKGECVGLVTTPQLHWMVWHKNCGAPHTESDYFDTLITAFGEFVEGGAQDSKQVLVVDAANGVGGIKLALIRERLQELGLHIQIRNNGDGVLNSGCGADFVQKEQREPRGFQDVAPGIRCASMDGDADRLVYFVRDGSRVQLCDGDRVAVLAAVMVQRIMNQCGDALGDVKVGVVQTAYANGNSTAYLCGPLQCEVLCRPTGVKNLHHAAQQFDVGLYWEANGHGTMLFGKKLLEKLQQLSPDVAAARQLLALSRMVNQAVGDALSVILLVEAALRCCDGSMDWWGGLYRDLPTRQLKVVVPDRTLIKTTNYERQVAEPQGLQHNIDQCVSAVEQGRAFVRPSGTEDIVRVYAEATTQQQADSLAQQVAQLVKQQLN